MYCCHGCNKILGDDEVLFEAALEYYYCSDCVTSTTPKQLQLALT